MWHIFMELALMLGKIIMGLVIWLEIVLKLVGNVLDFLKICWKQHQLNYKFLE